MSELIFLGYDHREVYKRANDFLCNKKLINVVDKSRVHKEKSVYVVKVLYEEESNNV